MLASAAICTATRLSVSTVAKLLVPHRGLPRGYTWKPDTSANHTFHATAAPHSAPRCAPAACRTANDGQTASWHTTKKLGIREHRTQELVYASFIFQTTGIVSAFNIAGTSNDKIQYYLFKSWTQFLECMIEWSEHPQPWQTLLKEVKSSQSGKVCAVEGCSKVATRGGHVAVHVGDQLWTAIVPLCGVCNNWHNTGTYCLKEGTVGAYLPPHNVWNYEAMCNNLPHRVLKNIISPAVRGSSSFNVQAAVARADEGGFAAQLLLDHQRALLRQREGYSSCFGGIQSSLIISQPEHAVVRSLQPHKRQSEWV